MTVASHLAAQIIRVLPRRSISRLVGQLCDASLPGPLSHAVVHLYKRAYRIDLSEVVPQKTPYASFDAFFTRQLVDGARPVEAAPDEVVSPADGRLQCLGRIEKDCRLLVKEKCYTVGQLLGDEQKAKAYQGGQFAVTYLSPRDYHRVHAPVSGLVRSVRGISGDFFPVNSLGELCSPTLLVTNERAVIEFDTEALGPVALVMVGAMVVGRISVRMLQAPHVPEGLHPIEPPCSLQAGDEVGAFHLGSTTVVLVGEKAPAWRRRPGVIRMGQSLVRVG